MILSLFMAAAVAASPPAPGRVVSLVAGEGKSQCLPDRSLCLEVPAAKEGAAADAVLRVLSPGAQAVSLALPEFPEAQSVDLWPKLIRAKGGDGANRYLVGILTGQTSMYSGGGGSASQLHLIELDATPNAARLGGEAIEVPWSGSLLIRACFSEEDMKDRLDACHDEYEFGATLVAAPGGAALFPTLSYRAVATAFPRSSRRSEDNSATKLKRADLVRARDPACTYDRVLRYDAAAARYQMDRPAPDCSDYTTP
ncbi:MAG: hypothetical protein ACTHJU_02400 [Sphingopyxis sp.]